MMEADREWRKGVLRRSGGGKREINDKAVSSP